MAYCVRSDIEDRFGVANVTTWADLDNDANASKITARITRAITVAEDQVNVLLRGGAYAIPFSGTPTMIKDICAVLAGVWLYDARGVAEYDVESGKSQHRLHHQRDAAMKKLVEIRTGDLDINVAMVDTTPYVG